VARPALIPLLILIALVLALVGLDALGATEDSVVRIEATVGGKTRFGSGFVVQVDGASGYVATAAHVVEGDPAPRVFFLSQPHSPVRASFIRLEGDDPNGFAVLRVDSGVPAGTRPLEMAEGGGMDLSVRNAVEAVGIPATIGNWAVFPGAVLSWKNRIILFSGDVDEGNSGGPLLAGGAVVGMVMRALRFGEAIPALNLDVFLRNNGVAWASAGGAKTSVRASDAAKPSPLELPTVLAPLKRPVAKPGETFRDCPTCPEMVVIPAGTFQMGSPEGEPYRTEFEGPVHTVTFDRPFAIARHEVTFDQWDACVRDGGCQHRPDDAGWGRGARPVINVSWEDAKEYVQWLSRKTGQDYRLPGEAEWEYAARAGTRTARFWGEDPDAACRYANVSDETHKGEQAAVLPLPNQTLLPFPKHNCNDGYAGTAPVAHFEANAFGLNDMLGNVGEWTEDCWNDSYRGAPSDGSAWTKGECGKRVWRGGSWGNDPVDVRSANRNGDGTGDRDGYSGFRPARTL